MRASSGNTSCRFFSFYGEGTFIVLSSTGGSVVWLFAPFSCFLVGFLLLFPCVSRYALLARGSAFRLYAGCQFSV